MLIEVMSDANTGPERQDTVKSQPRGITPDYDITMNERNPAHWSGALPGRGAYPSSRSGAVSGTCTAVPSMTF
jgi:hypothetical protein